MASYVTVRVVGRDGRPKKGARVGMWLHRSFLDSGFKRDNQYTDGEGETEFVVDDARAVTIYVDGAEVAKEHPVESYIKVTV